MEVGLFSAPALREGVKANIPLLMKHPLPLPLKNQRHARNTRYVETSVIQQSGFACSHTPINQSINDYIHPLGHGLA